MFNKFCLAILELLLDPWFITWTPRHGKRFTCSSCSDANSPAFGERLTLFCLVSRSPALPLWYINLPLFLQLLTPQKNSEKSNSKPIISINIETGEERRYISIKKASDELNIHAGNISSICCKRKSCKTAKSKKDGKKYSFKYLD